MESIAVITITRGRPELLRRAIASVSSQRIDAHVEHMILVDNCEGTRMLLKTFEGLPSNLIWHWMPRNPGECSGPSRSSRMRNYGVRIADADWIAFLDDDNEWKDNHLSELLDCATQSGLRAVHSHRILLNPDGAPYLEDRFPWCRDRQEARRIYRELCVKGVFTPGSCVVRDRADPIDHPDPVWMVDTGEWLLAPQLLLEVPFDECFTAIDEATVTSEDDKLRSYAVGGGYAKLWA